MRLFRVVYWLVVLMLVSFSDFQFAAVSIFMWMGCFLLVLLFMQDQNVRPSRDSRSVITPSPPQTALYKMPNSGSRCSGPSRSSQSLKSMLNIG
jgi:hypothetical protein